MMKNAVRLLSFLIVLAAAVIVGLWIGRKQGQKDSQTVLIENYAFVRDIAELSSLEVNGISTYKSSNTGEDDGFLAAVRKTLLEKSVTITAPYTAKYGVDLNDSNMHFERRDSVLLIHLPAPQLLSFELRLDRMETSNRKGWLMFQNDELYTGFQKRMYQQSRAQLEQNTLYLRQSQEKICGILQRYFAPMGLKTQCVFGSTVRVEKN